MNAQAARIVLVKEHSLIVSVENDAACGGCRSKASCSPGTLREVDLPDARASRLRAQDEVMLTLPDGMALRAALLAYALPILGFLCGMILAAGLGQADAGSALGGCLGLLLGFGGARLLSRRLRASFRLQVSAIQPGLVPARSAAARTPCQH